MEGVGGRSFQRSERGEVVGERQSGLWRHLLVIEGVYCKVLGVSELRGLVGLDKLDIHQGSCYVL